MKTKASIKKLINFDSYLQQQLKNPKFKEYYDEFGKQLEIAYLILQMRKEYGISQKELAKRIGTTQSNVARIESGNQNYTTATLQKIAKVFDREMKIEFV